MAPSSAAAAGEPRPRETEVDGDGAGVLSRPPIAAGGDCGAGAGAMEALARVGLRRIGWMEAEVEPRAGWMGWEGRWREGGGIWKGKGKGGGLSRKEAAGIRRRFFNRFPSRAMEEGSGADGRRLRRAAVGSWDGARPDAAVGLVRGVGTAQTVRAAWVVSCVLGFRAFHVPVRCGHNFFFKILLLFHSPQVAKQRTHMKSLRKGGGRYEPKNICRKSAQKIENTEKSQGITAIAIADICHRWS